MHREISTKLFREKSDSCEIIHHIIIIIQFDGNSNICDFK